MQPLRELVDDEGEGILKANGFVLESSSGDTNYEQVTYTNGKAALIFSYEKSFDRFALCALAIEQSRGPEVIVQKAMSIADIATVRNPIEKPTEPPVILDEQDLRAFIRRNLDWIQKYCADVLSGDDSKIWPY